MLLTETRPADAAALLRTMDCRGYGLPPGVIKPDEVPAMPEGWSARLLAAQGRGSRLAVQRGEMPASLAVMEPLSDGSVKTGCAVSPARRGRVVATIACSA